jgi:hypothetical protein
LGIGLSQPARTFRQQISNRVGEPPVTGPSPCWHVLSERDRFAPIRFVGLTAMQVPFGQHWPTRCVMRFLVAMVLMIGPAPTPDLIGTWQGPHMIQLVNKRGWGPNNKSQGQHGHGMLLLQVFPPPEYQYLGPTRCRFEHTPDLVVLRDCPYGGEYTRGTP